MKIARVETPSGQNWNCHGCSDCCRGGMFIPLSLEDRQRIEQQNWTAADGVDGSRAIVGGISGARLGHREDGACVFLDANGRCKIHAKFGEAAKPLACRLFPLVIHPAGKKLVVGLRFSCPSAAANRGKPLADQAPQIPSLAKIFLPDGYEKIPPPPVAVHPGLDWPDFFRFVNRLDASLAAPEIPIALKLLRALHWLGKVEQGSLDQIAGDGADEILDALIGSASEKIPRLPEIAEPTSSFGRLFFRLMVLEHAQAPTVADRDVRSSHRWRMLGAALRVMRANGKTPALRPELPTVRFADIEKDFGPLPPAVEALLTRYYRVKIQGLQFCGKAFFDRPLVEGFRNLALMFPVVIWIARWRAVGEGRSSLTEADVLRAVAIADHQYGYTPYLKWRTKLLQQRHDIARLCAWAAR
jgi:lysine-N-methylase